MVVQQRHPAAVAMAAAIIRQHECEHQWITEGLLPPNEKHHNNLVVSQHHSAGRSSSFPLPTRGGVTLPDWSAADPRSQLGRRANVSAMAMPRTCPLIGSDHVQPSNGQSSPGPLATCGPVTSGRCRRLPFTTLASSSQHPPITSNPLYGNHDHILALLGAHFASS